MITWVLLSPEDPGGVCSDTSDVASHRQSTPILIEIMRCRAFHHGVLRVSCVAAHGAAGVHSVFCCHERTVMLPSRCARWLMPASLQ
jgi:hypothetical protein